MNYSKVKEFYESKVNHALLPPVELTELETILTKKGLKLSTEFKGYLTNVSCEFVLLNGSIIVELDDLPTKDEQSKIIIPSQLKKIFSDDFLPNIIEKEIVVKEVDEEESDEESDNLNNNIVESFQSVNNYVKAKKPISTKIKYEDFEKIMITIGYIDKEHLLKLCLAKGDKFDSVWLMTGDKEFTWICSSFEEFLQINGAEYLEFKKKEKKD